MIIHRLIAHHLRHGDDDAFYRLQAEDTVRWLKQMGIDLSIHRQALDLGCGHGILGQALQKEGCQVQFSDQRNTLCPSLSEAPFIPIDLDRDSLDALGTHDLVICSNVLEHLSDPDRFLNHCVSLLRPKGYLYLSWTNWLSFWGGHDFSPFHYLGPRLGHRVFDRLIGRKRIHTPFETLYPTYIGDTLNKINRLEGIHVIAAIPRYYPELRPLMSVPILREFLAWNCAILVQRGSA
tara:strand:+ start:856 stop:1563 length:708 start_codon:yes stop_codon:yes gene_type:complete